MSKLTTIVKCEHWSECGVKGGGCCELGIYNKPSFGVCLLACKDNTNKPKKKKAEKMLNVHQSVGLGDTVKKIINKVTGGKAKQCGGCKKRQAKLNKLFPYKKEDGELNGN